MTASPLIVVRGLVKQQALRPLRIEALELSEGELVSITGLDAAAAELFVGLLTGAVVPDAGDVRLFGRSTADIADADAWLTLLDGVGIMTDRAVLVAQFTVEQNLAMPYTLDIDPVTPELRPRVKELAEEVGLHSESLAIPVAETRPEQVARVRLGRALALNPSVLLAEHPSATVPAAEVKAFAHDLLRVAQRRRLAALVVTADLTFARTLGGLVLAHDPVSGALKRRRQWADMFQRT
ncbi:MAG: hypothetical protein ACT4QD_27270 [Acidobacteriota bacterium]